MAATACDRCVVYLFRLSPIHWTCTHNAHRGREPAAPPPQCPKSQVAHVDVPPFCALSVGRCRCDRALGVGASLKGVRA